MLQLLLGAGRATRTSAACSGSRRDEVRSRARAAPSARSAAPIPTRRCLTDYLLGQADPIGRADAVRQLQNDPEANALASRLVAQLRLLAPRAQLPEIPAPRGGRRAQAPPAAAGRPAPERPPGRGSAGLRSSPRRGGPSHARDRLAAGASGLASRLRRRSRGSLFGLARPRRPDHRRGARGRRCLRRGRRRRGRQLDRDRDRRQRGPDDRRPWPRSAAVRGHRARRCSRGSEDQPVLQINLTGLEPAGKDQNYIVWLYNSDAVAFPLGARPGQPSRAT